MKKFIKTIPLFVVIILSLVFLFPLNVAAFTYDTPNINVNEIKDFQVDNLYFYDISFKNNASTSSLNFGVSGKITNNYSKPMNYVATAYYYDSNNILIAIDDKILKAMPGTYDFNLMSDLDVLGGHTVDEIAYYTLFFSMSDNDIYSDTNSNNDTSDDTSSIHSKYNTYPYVIEKYDVDIVVNEDNSLDVTEKITAYFKVAKHGIFRTIPLRNTVSRQNGTTSKNRVRITNLSVDNEYTTSREGGNYKIKIGSANYTLTGEQTYTIKYTYNLGKDPIEDYDELYYNIIGTEWDTIIGNVTFRIEMPKEFDSSKLGFTSGVYGSTNTRNVSYNVDGNIITGSYNGILNPSQALTVRTELPEGYFTNQGRAVSTLDYLIIIIPILFLVIAILLWYKFGKDDPVVETVEFYPPEGLNSLDVGLLYKGNAENKDVTSLLVYLANKGYIEIDDLKISLDSVKLNDGNKDSANEKLSELQRKLDEEKSTNPKSKKIRYYENMIDIYKNIDTPINYEEYGLKSEVKRYNAKNNYLIKKIKDYDGDNKNEKWFMEGLFRNNRNEVTEKQLYNEFYITNHRILSNINSKKNIEKIFEKKSSNKRIPLVLMTIIILCIITIPPILYYGDTEIMLAALLFPGIGLTVLTFGLFGKVPLIVKIFLFFWGAVFGGIPWVFMVLPAIMEDSIYLIGYIVGIICFMGIIICYIYIPKRTKYGNEMLGKLRGFKNFLETVEKAKLESLVLENPNYFYDILPYTYVLDVSDKWIKKFETISLEAPSWYDGPSSFNVYSFGNFMDSTMKSAQSVMSSSPSSSDGGSSSGGGSSGGGSSGGGSGGGGGGSW